MRSPRQAHRSPKQKAFLSALLNLTAMWPTYSRADWLEEAREIERGWQEWRTMRQPADLSD